MTGITKCNLKAVLISHIPYTGKLKNIMFNLKNMNHGF